MAVLDRASARAEWRQRFVYTAEPLRGAFFWLSAFFIVYCARPEDWIPGLKYIPLAKISGLFALGGLVFSAGRSKRGLRDLPREAFYLMAMIGFLVIAGALSPVWKGGSLIRTLEFAKLLVAWVLTFFVITSFARLRRIIFIQSASVALIAMVSLLKGRDHPRLEGVIGGIYSNPNDLAFAIVLSLPFCVAFLLHTKSMPRKGAWVLAMLAMFTALFLTASRGGFVTLLATAAVGLWHFGVKGRRPQLIAAVLLAGLIVGVTAGGRLKDRFLAISGDELNDPVDVSAHGSYEQRARLMEKSVEGLAHYPWGIGLGNFPNYSGTWRQVHVAYLQIAVEGGIAACVFYLLFFGRGFANLRQLRKLGAIDDETDLFAAALHTSLVGFVVGALFAPEAYQFFPYFAVAYSSVLLAIAKEKTQAYAIVAESPRRSLWERRYGRAGEMTAVR
jgi:O-antigen ligase